MTLSLNLMGAFAESVGRRDRSRQGTPQLPSQRTPGDSQDSWDDALGWIQRCPRAARPPQAAMALGLQGQCLPRNRQHLHVHKPTLARCAPQSDLSFPRRRHFPTCWQKVAPDQSSVGPSGPTSHLQSLQITRVAERSMSQPPHTTAPLIKDQATGSSSPSGRGNG